MFASAYVQNGAKVYIASRKEKQLKEVLPFPDNFRASLTRSSALKVSEALNKKGPGSCHYIVADVSVSILHELLSYLLFTHMLRSPKLEQMLSPKSSNAENQNSISS